MTDPFSDVEAAGPDFVAQVVQVLEDRAAEPVMQDMVARYLEDITLEDGALHVEIGCGSGPVTRALAAKARNGTVIGIDPSEGLVAAAVERAAGIDNLSFEVGDGAATRFANGTARTVILHTVLSHVPDPAALMAEAVRILAPGGSLIVFDGDFSKGTLANYPGDPFEALSAYFKANFVVDPYICGKLPSMAREAGLAVRDFRVANRVITETDGMMAWVKFTTTMMVEKGQIGPGLATALTEEYERRMEAGTLYGFQCYVTLVARKPE